jgi:hypothetical protein
MKHVTALVVLIIDLPGPILLRGFSVKQFHQVNLLPVEMVRGFKPKC